MAEVTTSCAKRPDYYRTGALIAVAMLVGVGVAFVAICFGELIDLGFTSPDARESAAAGRLGTGEQTHRTELGSPEGMRHPAEPSDSGLNREPVIEPPHSCQIIGSCVDASSRVPLPGILIRHVVTLVKGNGLPTQDYHYRTDLGGGFRLETSLLTGAVHEVIIEGDGWCQRRAWMADLRADSVCDLGTIELQAGVRVDGELVDEQGGPVANEHVMVVAPGIALPTGLQQSPYHNVVTDANGRYSFLGLAEGDFRLHLIRSDLEFVSGETVTVPATPSVPVWIRTVVRAIPGIRIHVTSPQQKPMGGAIVRATVHRVSGSRVNLGTMWADSNGDMCFPVPEFKTEDRLGYVAWASGFRMTHVESHAVKAVDVILVPGWETKLHVTDLHDGKPIERFSLRHWEEGPLPMKSVLISEPTEHSPGGSRQLSGLGATNWLIVRAEGYCESDLILVEEKPVGLQSGLHVKLTQVGRLAIQCRDASGMPLVGSVEVVSGDVKDSALVHAVPLGIKVGPHYQRPQVIARVDLDRSGSALVPDLRPGKVWIRPLGFWCEPFSFGPIEVRGRETVDAEIGATKGSVVRGMMEPPDAVRWVKTMRLVSKANSERVFPFPGQAESLSFSSDGNFEWSGVPAGVWSVEIRRRSAESGVLIDVQVGELSTPDVNEVEIDLRAIMPASIQGRIALQELKSPPIEVIPIGHAGRRTWRASPIPVSADGFFYSSRLDPAKYRWLIRVGERELVVLRETTELFPGTVVRAELTPAKTRQLALYVEPEGDSRQLSLGYDMAPGVVIKVYTIGDDHLATIRVAKGEPFIVQQGFGPWRRPVGVDTVHSGGVIRVPRR